MSDLVLENWECDFPAGKCWFDFAWTETLSIRYYVTLDFDEECEWKYYNGQDYEECRPVAILFSADGVEVKHTNGGDMEGERHDELLPEDEKEMQAVIDDEYEKYLEDCRNDYYD
jgi:hypothetical protein